MKKVLCFLLALILMLPMLMKAQGTDITVGTGTSTSYSAPFNNYYKNSWNECIYPASAFNTTGGYINSISWYTGSSVSLTTSTLKIYMGTTTRTTHSSTSDWQALDDLELVYDGTGDIIGGTSGWQTFTLDNQFYYDGVDNLVVVVSKTASSYNSSISWQYTSTSNACLYRQNDSDLSYANHPGSNTGTQGNHRANIKVNLTPAQLSCPRPMDLAITDLTYEDATFSWTPTGTEAGWDVYITDSGIAPDSTTTDITAVTGTFYTFTGLMPNTVYTAYVRANCGSEFSMWRAISFRTECSNELAIPLLEDFENDGTGSGTYPRCWSKITTASGYPYIYSSNQTSGANSLYLYNTTANYSVVILPPVDQSYNMSDLMISFDYARLTYADGYLVLGVMSDDSTLTSFEPLDTINPIRNNIWQTEEFYFDNYTGTGRHIAILSDGRDKATANQFCIDHLEVKPIPDCRHPKNFHVSNVTTNSITVEWEGTASQWEIAIDTIGYDVDSVQMNYIIATTNSYTLTNLTSGEQYDIYVRGACNGEYTEWSDRLRVKPICDEIATLPFQQTYDGATELNDVPTCMTRLSYYYTNVPLVTSDSKLYFVTLNSNPVYASLAPLASNISFSDVQLRFNAKTTTTGQSIQIGVMTNPYDPSTFELVETYIPSSTSAWEEHTTFMDGYTGTGRYISFRYNNSTSSTVSFYLDTINVENIPTCFNPQNLQVSNIAGASAYITWEPGLREFQTSYTLEYSEQGLNTWTPVTVTDNNYLLGGLTQQTTYDIRVKSNCPASNSDYITGEFTTVCLAGGAISFDDGTSTTYSIPINDYYNYTLTEQLFLSSEMNGATTINSVAFDYAYSSPMTAKTNVDIYLGHTTKTSFSSTSDYVPFSDLHLVYSGALNCTQQGWNTFQLDSVFQYNGVDNLVLVIDDNSGDYDGNSYVFKYKSQTDYMTLYYNSDSNNPNVQSPSFSDPTQMRSNVIFGGSCDQVTCPNPNVVVNNITDITADIQIAAGQNENAWMVEYKAANDTDWTSMGTVTSAPISLTGLTGNTTYTVRVKAVCSASDQSDWKIATFTTECTIIASLPYTEDFESFATGSTSHPDCWSWKTNYSSTQYPYIASVGGSKALYFYGYNTNYSLAVLPTIDETQITISQTMLKFKLRKTSDSYKIKVGVISNPEDYTTFEEVAEYSPIQTNVWEEFDCAFNNYTGTGKYIAFLCYTGNTTSSYMYVDDVELVDLPSCLRPATLTASNSTQTTVDLTWDQGDAQAWDVVAVPAGSTLDDEIANNAMVSVYSNSTTLSNLNTGTYYTVYVRSNCGSETSTWIRSSFFTECGQISSFPYAETFDVYGTGTNAYPNCWTRTNSNYPYITSTSHSGAGGLYFYAYTSTSYDRQYAVLPRIANADANSDTIMLSKLQLKFSIYDDGYDNVIHVGVMTDPNVDSTFHLVQTITLSTSNWENKTVFFNNYQGQGRYVAFYCPTYTGSSIYVDDVVLDWAPVCSPVENLTVSRIVGTSAYVTWNDGPQGVTADYTLEYSEHGLDAWVSVNSVSNTHYMLTDLTPNTSYDVRVKANCDDSSESNWVTETFVTKCLAGGEIEVTGSGASTEYAIPVNNWYSYSYSQQIILNGEMNGATILKSISFQYDYSSSMTEKTDCKIYLGHTSQSAFASTTDYISANDLHLVYTGSLNCSQGWNTFYFDSTFNYNGVDNLVVAVLDNSDDYDGTSYAFNVHNANGVRTLYFYTDDGIISMTNPPVNSSSTTNYRNNMILGADCDSLATCIAPNVIAGNITDNTAEISWAAGNGESDWNMEYKSAFDTAWTIIGSGNVSPYLLTNLASNTSYTVRMQSICGGGDVSVWKTVSFTTECDVINTPYSESFGSYQYGVLPDCWTSKTTYSTTTQYPYVYDNIGHDNDGTSLYFCSGSSSYTVAALPEIDSLQPLSDLQLKFWMYYSSTGYKIQVGVMTDPTDVSTFVPVDTAVITTASTWESVSVTFENYTGNGRYIAFLSDRRGESSYNYIYIDEVSLDIAPACGYPTNLNVSNITGTSLDVSWTDDAAESSWQMVYAPEGQTPDFSNPTPVTSSTQTLTDLSSNTGYTLYVRTICSNGNGYSEWVNMTFSTINANPATLPYLCDFSDANENAEWGMSNGTNTNQWVIGNPAGYTDGVLFVSDDNGANAHYSHNGATVWAYRDIQFPAGPEFELSFNWVCGGESTYDYFKVYIGTPVMPVVKSTRVSPTDNSIQPTGSQELVQKLNLNLAGSTFTATLPGSDYANSIKRIYFMWTNDDNGGDQNPAIIDSVSITARSCGAPSNLVAFNITSTTADVNFTPNETTDNSWEYALLTSGNNPNTVTPVPIPTSTINLTGLNPATNYNVYVRTLCSDNTYSSWSAVYTFTTECAAIAIPYTENFDSYTATGSSSHPNCWTTNSTYNSSYPYISNGYSASPGKSLYFYGSSSSGYSMGVLPEIDATYPVSSLMLSFNMRVTTSTVGMIVGVMTDPTDASTFVPVDTLFNTATSVFETHTVSLTSYSGNGQYIALKTHTPSSGSSIYLDDLVVDTDTSYVPTDCNVPTALAVNNITTTTATATWTAGGSETAWDLQYKLASANDWGTVIPVSAHTYNFAGLTANTQYKVRVRANCGDSQSAWTNEVSFTTQDNAQPGCEAPTNLATSSVTANSVVLTWTENGTATSWTVYYKEDGVSTWSTATANATTYTLTGLNAETAYSAYVVANCTDGQSGASNTVTFTTEGTGIEDYAVSTVLFPNPTDGQIVIRTSEVTMTTVGIYDVYGKLLKTVQVNGNEATIDVAGYASGMYFARIATEKGVVTKSFVKK